MIKLYPNGFVVKSNEENLPQLPCDLLNYCGIGRFESWPLDRATDSLSKTINKEMNERWFGYYDSLYIVPDIVFLRRYLKHCKNCGIDVSTLFIESPNSNVITRYYPRNSIFMGYDYSDSDMNTSCLFDDLVMKDSYVYNSFKPIRERRNSNGMLSTLRDLELYISIRNTLISKGYDMEEYYNPIIIRISRIPIDEFGL